LFKISAPVQIPAGGISPLDVFHATNAEQIAQQLTIVDFAMYSNLRGSEFLNQSWNKPQLKHRSPNVVNLIQRSTRLSLWIASMVLHEDKVTQRAKVIEKMIDICTCLKKLHNYNTLMGTIAGLNISSVHRLKKTMKLVSKQKRKELEEVMELMSSDSSFKIYRKTLHSVVPPVIPYIGVSLTDLTFIEDGNPDMVNGHINFRKRELIYKVIQSILQNQPIAYKISPVEPLHTFLQELAYNQSEDDLYNFSLYVEPREKKTQ